MLCNLTFHILKFTFNMSYLCLIFSFLMFIGQGPGKKCVVKSIIHFKDTVVPSSTFLPGTSC